MTTAALMLLFTVYTDKYNLPTGLLSAVCWVESHHKVSAVNKDDGQSGSLGICQVQPDTAKMLGFRGTPKQLMNPKMNIKYAAKYLRYQLDRYDDNTYKAIGAYNAGSFKVFKTDNYWKKKLRKNEHRHHKGDIVNRSYIQSVLHAWARGK